MVHVRDLRFSSSSTTARLSTCWVWCQKMLACAPSHALMDRPASTLESQQWTGFCSVFEAAAGRTGTDTWWLKLVSQRLWTQKRVAASYGFNDKTCQRRHEAERTNAFPQVLQVPSAPGRQGGMNVTGVAPGGSQSLGHASHSGTSSQSLRFASTRASSVMGQQTRRGHAWERSSPTMHRMVEERCDELVGAAVATDAEDVKTLVRTQRQRP